jgi:acetyltransferase-like isoleucine patch superfamily enzyme
MKYILQRTIQLRNPNFIFDDDLNGAALLSFIWVQGWDLLRGLNWLFYFKKPKMTMMGKRVSFFNSSKIKFGKYLKLGNDVHLSALGKHGILIGDNVGIGPYSRVVVSTSMNNLGEFIKIGNNVGIGEFSYLGGAGGLEIGDECIIGQYFSCHPENHFASDLNTAIRNQGVTRKGIKIGMNCWIGSKVTILDGAVIGDGCIIAAGAVVNKSFPSNSIIGGVPAKLLKSRI